MTRVSDALEVAMVDGKEVFRCLKCGNVLGPITQDYKNYCLKNDAPISKAQPHFLAPKPDEFVLREYYCPKCAVMFEVNMCQREDDK
jgi:acetone carboxylase gamma subunit